MLTAGFSGREGGVQPLRPVPGAFKYPLSTSVETRRVRGMIRLEFAGIALIRGKIRPSRVDNAPAGPCSKPLPDNWLEGPIYGLRPIFVTVEPGISST
jgi:hypothetical protein